MLQDTSFAEPMHPKDPKIPWGVFKGQFSKYIKSSDKICDLIFFLMAALDDTANSTVFQCVFGTRSINFRMIE